MRCIPLSKKEEILPPPGEDRERQWPTVRQKTEKEKGKKEEL